MQCQPETGKPFEVVYYFPLKPKLQALFKQPVYKKLLRHEFERPKNDELMTDVYDSPEWKKTMGPPSSPPKRVGVVLGVDAIPAFSSTPDSTSLKPWLAMMANLPPSIRTKEENMIVLALLPNGLKEGKQKKYYDWAAEYELNDVFINGIDGIKVNNKYF